MRHGGFSFRFMPRLNFAIPMGLGLAMTLTQCADVQTVDMPRVIPDDLQKELCVQEENALLLSEVLAGTQQLSSELSDSDCPGSQDGYFETWHVYADQTETVLVVAESDFDNLMRLVRVEDIQQTSSGYDVQVQVIDENDDQSPSDSRSRVAATLEAGEDYFLVLSGFNEDETGPYELELSPTASLPPSPDTGSLNVNVASEGAPPDTFKVTLNGAKAISVMANGTATYTGILAGDYAVEISGLGDCLVLADNPLNLVVSTERTATADFELSCPECATADQCPQGGACTVTLCAEGGICDTQAAEDGTPCEYNGGPGQCTSGVCGSTTCDPPCVDQDLNDCTEPFCPPASATCDARLRPIDSDCQKNDKDGKCDSLGTCDICAGVDCASTNECKEDSSCNATTGTCNPFDDKPANTPCNSDAGVCDGSGNCVACTIASQCPDDANQCTASACDAGQCGQNNLPDRSTCSFNGGAGECQGGVCVEAPDCTDNGDCDDLNVCTSDQCVVDTCAFTPVNGGACLVSDGVPGTCSAGTCVGDCVGKNCDTTNQCQFNSSCEPSTGDCNPFTNRPAGTPCAQSGGSVCDGNGNCVECSDASQCPDDSNECTSAACIAFACSQSNVTNGTLCDGDGGRCQSGVCEALTGSIGVMVNLSVTGPGGDKSYTLTIGGVSQGTIPPGSVFAYGPFPIGDYIVTLGGLNGDCSVTNASSQIATVPEGGNASIVFDVSCPPAAPQLLDIDNQLITLNQCGIPNTSTFRYSVDYYDGDGDITPSGTRVFIDIRWSNGTTQSYESERIYNNISGDGFTGAVQALNCISFGSATYADVTMTIWDASDRPSNALTTRVAKPAGAY